MNRSALARISLTRVAVGNSLLLSAAYLALGLGVELLRRWPSHAILRLAFALDALPAHVLAELGLFDALRTAYTEGRISEAAVRLCFAATTMALIFALGTGLAAGLAVARFCASRRGAVARWHRP